MRHEPQIRTNTSQVREIRVRKSGRQMRRKEFLIIGWALGIIGGTVFGIYEGSVTLGLLVGIPIGIAGGIMFGNSKTPRKLE